MAKSKYITELSLEQVAANREEVIRLLQSTNRQGIDDVIKYLDDNDFYTGAASGRMHDCMYGGLAYHSLLVYKEAKKVWEDETQEIKDQVPIDSLIIACLLHDICKVNTHPCQPGQKPTRVKFNKNYHGKKSVDILKSIGFQLTEAESLAIRWHMSCFTKEANLLEGEEISDYKRYAEKFPLVALTIIGDRNASGLSSGKPAICTTVAQLIENFKDETIEKKKMEYKKLEGKSDVQSLVGKKYHGLIFDMDYFDEQAKEDLVTLSEYTGSHNVKVGIVTMMDKNTWDKWLEKSAPIPVDHVVGSGSIKVGRTSFIRKPEAMPMLSCLAWLELEPCEALSVCTKDIDKEASEKAGIDIIVNPAPKDVIPLLTDEPKPKKEQPVLKEAPTTGIFGAVCGDIIGSVYELHRTKDYNFELFASHSHATDDSILTMAIAKWLMGDHSDENLAHQLIHFGRRHFERSHWGSSFKTWLESDDHAKREAGSNGSAMRVSPVGYYASSLEECLALARQSAELTHNSKEGIEGAQAIAASIFLVRQRKTKAEVKAYIEQQFGYNLDQTIDDIRDTYNLKEKFSCACNKCAAEAIVCWLVSDTYEETVRNAVSLGGDADTIAAMAGGIAAATPGMEIPQYIAEKCFKKLPDDLKETFVEWETRTAFKPEK